MNPQQALQIMVNVANIGIANGNMFKSVEEASTVNMALQVLKAAIGEPEMAQPNAELGDGQDDQSND